MNESNSLLFLLSINDMHISDSIKQLKLDILQKKECVIEALPKVYSSKVKA